MALPILDGNQSATTLSSILTGGEHIPAHTVVSLGTQAITDIRGAVSGSVVSISNFPATQPVSIASVTVGNTVTIAGTVTANPTGTQTIAGTVKVDGAFNANGVTAFPSIPLWYNNQLDLFLTASTSTPFPISGTVTIGNSVTIGSALPAGTNRIGVVTIGGGSVTLGASTAQIGSVTASIIGTVPVSISSVTVGNSITIGSCVTHGVTIANTSVTVNGTFFQATQPVSLASLPALAAGTAQIGSVTASISNSVTIASLPAISGTVTANSSNGSLTTRFGSVTTANTAFATSAVTNASRKYLLIQNVTTASNVITVGIGFTPTTTQGIQLSSGAGLTFEGSYIPTGAVNLLSSVTASCFTILEA